MDLPLGQMNCVLHGVKKGDVFLVMNLTVLDIETVESPFEYAAGHQTIIEFREKVRKPTRQVSRDADLVRRDGVWALSDHEWSAVAQLLLGGRRHANQKYHVRHIVDHILEKMGTGVPVRTTPFHGIWPNTTIENGSSTGSGSPYVTCSLR